jgi:hypothetical protein
MKVTLSYPLQENMVKEEVEISHRVHSMIIGRRGMGIRCQRYKTFLPVMTILRARALVLGGPLSCPKGRRSSLFYAVFNIEKNVL